MTRSTGLPRIDRTGLLSVATAVPPHLLTQVDAARIARTLFAARYPDFDRLEKVFATTGIQTRHLIRPVDWYLEQRGWGERTEGYLDGACDLFVDAARRALDAAGCQACEVDTVITISSTGIATPSIEARVHGRMGFRPDVQRVPVFGLGCAGGVQGLALADRLARAAAGSTVLLVAVEVCSAAFRLDTLTKANIVATALFGDGAAAAVLRSGAVGLASIEGAGEHLWADTLGIMGWSVDEVGLGVIFDREIPPFARDNVGPAIDEILRRIGVERSAVGRFVCHPGGAKVVQALEATLDLGQGTLDHERAVLAAHGNMSAPTVLFVMDRVLKAGMPGRAVMTALGPGFSCGCVSLERAA
ncbi:type III polyketide synthase [Iodidimonas sp. SYSU 1G8]|uniref:type III polyketide synthase n=1 Tax=Iodidimonas sp. SYSU 1G8 TaxID=3133967 RepID=UPI0031FF26BE